MRHTLFSGILISALAIAGCGESHTGGDASTGSDGGGTSDFAGAYVMNDCAPDDGQALRVILYAGAVPECSADPDRPSLSFYLFSGTDIVFPITAGTTITSDASAGGFGNGSATYCLGGAAPCQTSGNFTITFDAFTADASAAGHYTITWEDGSTRSGTFDATWCMNGLPLCG